MKNTKLFQKLAIGGISLALMIGVAIVFQHGPTEYLKFLQALTFFVDAPPPAMMQNVFPLNGSKVSSDFRTFVIKFARPMDATTINATNINMKDALNNAITGTVTYDSNVQQATFKASTNFTVTSSPNNNPFTLTVGSGVKDSAGATLGSNVTAAYTISAGTNASPPAYSYSDPFNNSTNVSIYNTAIISTAFNIPLDPTTVTAANLSVTTTPATDPPVTISGIGTTTYNPYNNSIEILTSLVLLPNTTYAITVSSNVKSATGIPVAPYTTRFTTGSTNEAQPAPAIVWSDFRTDGIEIEWNAAMFEPLAENVFNHTLVCNGSAVDLASSIIEWNAVTLRSNIGNLTLTSGAACDLTLSPSITNINNTAVAITSRIQTGTVHAPYSGKGFLTSAASTTAGSWLDLDNCSSYTDLNLANCPSFIFNNPLNIAFSDLVANESHTSTAIFTIPVVKSFTTGYKLVITAPYGGSLIGSATANNVLNNDITPDIQVVNFSSITNNETQKTMTLVLNVANNATISTGSQLKFAIDNISNPNVAGTYKFEYKLTDANNITLQQGVFNSITFASTGASTANIVVRDRSNNNAIANVKVVFTAPNIGTTTLTTDGTGTASFASLPDTGMHIEAYILGDSVPATYLPSWTNTSFDLPAGSYTSTKTLYLDPANFTINATIQHSGIGTNGATKVDAFASGQNGWISRLVTLSATGTTNVTLRTGAGDYNVGVGQHFDLQSSGTDNIAFVLPATQSVKVGTGLPTPSVTLSLAQANKNITGTILDTNGKALSGFQVVATSNQSTFYATTDTNGAFNLAVTTGNYTVTASKYGLAGKIEKQVVIATTDTTVALGNLTVKKPTRYISGTVQDSNGNKIKNATVNCYNATNSESVNGLTDSSGLYVVYVPTGTYTCEASVALLGSIPAASGVNTTSIVVGASDITSINFSLNRGNNGNITVTVRNSSGIAVEGNFVWAEKFDKNTKQFIAYGNGASTDQAGQVILNVARNNASTEIYYVETLGTNDEKLSIASNVNIASADANLGIFTLPAYQQVTFNVSGLQSNTTEAEINVHDETTDDWSTATIAVTNGAGSTTISLPAGSYTGYLRVNGVSETIKTFTVSGSAASVSFDFSTTQMTLLTVYVQDNSGAPLKDVFVNAFEQDKDVSANGTTDTQGYASLNLIPGTYFINASKQNYTNRSATATVTTATRNEATFVLASASSNIILSVKDSSNTAVANAWVDAITSDGSNKWAGGRTDGNGALTLKVEPNTKWNITARDENGIYGTASNISPGVATVTVTLNQTQAGFVSSKPKNVSLNPTKDNVVSSDVAKLTIPAGALGKNASGTNISIKNVSNTPSIGALGALGNQAVEISSTDSSGKAITKLNSNISAEITLNKVRIDALINSGVAPEKLNTPVGFFNTATNTWETVKGSTIYVTRQAVQGGPYVTTTITDFLNKRPTDYANDYDDIIHYVFKPNHFTLFAPIGTRETLFEEELKPVASRKKTDTYTPCRAAAPAFSSISSFFSNLFNFFKLKTGP